MTAYPDSRHTLQPMHSTIPLWERRGCDGLRLAPAHQCAATWFTLTFHYTKHSHTLHHEKGCTIHTCERTELRCEHRAPNASIAVCAAVACSTDNRTCSRRRSTPPSCTNTCALNEHGQYVLRAMQIYVPLCCPRFRYTLLHTATWQRFAAQDLIHAAPQTYVRTHDIRETQFATIMYAGINPSRSNKGSE